MLLRITQNIIPNKLLGNKTEYYGREDNNGDRIGYIKCT